MAKGIGPPDDIERILEGRAPADPQLAGLHRVLGQIRATYSSLPDDGTRARHLEAMSSAFGRPTVQRPSRLRRRMASRAAAAAAGLVLMGGTAMAATGTLPAPAQDAVAKVARRVGIPVPRSEKAEKAQGPKKTPPTAEYRKAKKLWTDCVAQHPGGNSDGGECGPAPRYADFKTPKPSEPGKSGEQHGQGDEHRTTPTHSPNDKGRSDDVKTPNPHAGSENRGPGRVVPTPPTGD